MEDDTEVKPAPTGQAGPFRMEAAGPPTGWREMKAGDLVKLCRHVGLPTVGKRAELLKRLDLHYHGSSSEHVHGKVLCLYCGSPARVNGTRWMSETLLRRSYRCTGKRRHSFHLDSQEKRGPVQRTPLGKRKG